MVRIIYVGGLCTCVCGCELERETLIGKSVVIQCGYIHPEGTHLQYLDGRGPFWISSPAQIRLVSP